VLKNRSIIWTKSTWGDGISNPSKASYENDYQLENKKEADSSYTLRKSHDSKDQKFFGHLM
jgi:hypothetical protein